MIVPRLLIASDNRLDLNFLVSMHLSLQACEIFQIVPTCMFGLGSANGMRE
jgi:hypothetical protein